MEQANREAEGNPVTAEITFHELEAIINSIPEGVVQFALNSEMTLLYANEGFYRINGYTRGELSGRAGLDMMEQLVVGEDIAYLLQDISRQLKQSGTALVEFRSIHKNGGIVWLRMTAVNKLTERGGVLQCTLVDITQEKSLRQQLLIEQERYHIITEKFNDVIFEYSFENDSLYVSSKWEELYGLPLPQENIICNFLNGDIVYDEDKIAFSKMLDQFMEGIQNCEFEVRLRKKDDGYVWTNVTTTMICDEIGNPLKVIGKISDIDIRMREREKLIYDAQRDPFTKLYNKTTAESYIRACLRSADTDSRHALMIIDIDNFKDVNDSHGHLFGDLVLTEISGKLRDMFRSSDILGRFGGDEFVIFLKNVADKERIAEKARMVCDIFRETYTGEKKDYKISGSVGVSLFPDHGKSFPELFHKADAALYDAKCHGKDCYVIYNDSRHINDREEKRMLHYFEK